MIFAGGSAVLAVCTSNLLRYKTCQGRDLTIFFLLNQRNCFEKIERFQKKASKQNFHQYLLKMISAYQFIKMKDDYSKKISKSSFDSISSVFLWMESLVKASID